MDHVLIRQQYEFAAAHRLHTDQLTKQENQQVFGKCNNPSGHGHNYRLEVAVKAPIDPDGHTTPVGRGQVGRADQDVADAAACQPVMFGQQIKVEMAVMGHSRREERLPDPSPIFLSREGKVDCKSSM